MARSGWGSSAVLALFALGVLVAANVATAATIAAPIQVGGAMNWTVPTAANGLDYQTWANSQTFAFDDELAFSYQNGSHNVLLVNSTAYAACDTKDAPILSWDSGEDVVELSQLSEHATGPEYYFMCGYPGHCKAGQKFHIKVAAYVPPPPPPPAPTTESPNSRGSSRALPQFGVLILAIVLAFFTTPFL